MVREDLTKYDTRPKYMDLYLSYNGPHFNEKLLEFAVSKMKIKDENGEEKELEPYSIEDVDKLLKAHNVHLKNTDGLFDYVYVANMCKADFLNDSVPNEKYLARYVKNVIDDVDGYDGLVFNRWYADMSKKGIPINWYKMV